MISNLVSVSSILPPMPLFLLLIKSRDQIDDGKYSCGLFLDFLKAFDTVDHSILITKLSHYGIRGIAKQWFTSY